ncbi:MAG TPA: MFS transporter, partial [Flavobacterium sp.]|nr:MFS transporter [Flavobacterium sp.]
LMAFIGSLQYVLEHGQQDDWFNNKTIIILSTITVFGLVLFIWRELTYKRPVVNLGVLKDGNLRIGTVMCFILGFGLYGSTLIIPIYTQTILGWTATDAGLLLIPGSITTAFMMPIVGKLLQRGVPQSYEESEEMYLSAVEIYQRLSVVNPQVYEPDLARAQNNLGLLYSDTQRYGE